MLISQCLDNLATASATRLPPAPQKQTHKMNEWNERCSRWQKQKKLRRRRGEARCMCLPGELDVWNSEHVTKGEKDRIGWCLKGLMSGSGFGLQSGGRPENTTAWALLPLYALDLFTAWATSFDPSPSTLPAKKQIISRSISCAVHPVNSVSS